MAKTMTQKAAPGLGLDADLARKLLRDMVLIRRFEEKAAEAYALGKIGGFLHLSIGEEAVAAGATSVLRRDDYAISTYREHGHCLIKGSDPRRVMAELFGRVDGLSKGKGGSMHLFDKALNLAALWKLPVIWLCENNRYAMGTSLERALAQTEIWKFGETYGIPSEPVDGMDVMAVRDAVGRAVERARRDKTPALLEVRTYRFRGHSMRDPAGAVYRTKEEVEREKLRDPILLFRDRALKAGVLSDDDVKKIEKDVNDLVDEAVAFADASPEPPASELFTDIFKESA